MVYFADKKSTIGFCLHPVIVLWLIMLTNKLLSMEMLHPLANKVP